jgi:hypothetical protein
MEIKWKKTFTQYFTSGKALGLKEEIEEEEEIEILSSPKKQFKTVQSARMDENVFFLATVHGHCPSDFREQA